MNIQIKNAKLNEKWKKNTALSKQIQYQIENSQKKDIINTSNTHFPDLVQTLQNKWQGLN